MVICKCGEPFSLLPANMAYHETDGIQCDGCACDIFGHYLVYHCPTQYTDAHGNGYDVCAKCARDEQYIKPATMVLARLRRRNTASQADLNIGNDHEQVVYNELIKIAKRELKTQKKYLRHCIENIKDKTSFNEMISLKEYNAAASDMSLVGGYDSSVNVNVNVNINGNGKSVGLRQDNEELLQFPNKLGGFDKKKLAKLNLLDFYDSKIYLSRLIIVAQSINGVFHNTLKNNILANDKHCSYHAGPLKTISRCQLKAESDYAFERYPNCACLLDIVRCSIVYKDSNNLLASIKTISDRIKKGDTCIKKLVRLKNKFLLNKREFERTKHSARHANDWLYQVCVLFFRV